MNLSATLRDLANRWHSVWFRPQSTTPLEIIRIGVGLGLLVSYGGMTSHLLDFFGDVGWISLDALAGRRENPWLQSLLYYVSEPWQLYVFHAAFLCACTLLAVGWRTNWVKWLVLVGHISYLHRNPAIYYGVDNILASLTLILCLAPVGRALSLDHVRDVRRAKQRDLHAQLPPARSGWGFACTRLIQLQMAVFYFFAGIEKLRGDTWWNGDALWFALTNVEYTNIPLDWLAEHYWLVNVMSYFTLLVELSYPFLIWGRRTRPYYLVAALLLHLGIAVLMGLYLFSFVMAVGHLAFLRHEWLHDWGQRWSARIGSMEMIYDGNCGFCKRSVAWLLAFDGLNQISIRNYRNTPSPIVSSELADKALYVVLPDARALPGFDAYRHVVLRVPGLWWQIPLFYVPLLSRFFGRRIYGWVATHRHKISNWKFSAATSTCGIDETRSG